MRSLKDLLLDFLVLAAFFAAICSGAALARAGDPCDKWVETRDGRDVQTSEPVTCDGAHGPLEQFAELMKCVKAELPTCEVRRQAEADKADKVETALRREVQIEKKRGDKHAEENAKMRERLEELATVEVLTSKAWNTPALAGRYLLVRNDREAVCYELGSGLTLQH